MRSFLRTVLFVGVLFCGRSEPTAAQEVQPLAVGEMAPDFGIPGATRYGVLADSVRLRDYRGKTVVLAFFFRARTRG